MGIDNHAVGNGEESAGEGGVGGAFAPDEPVATLLDLVGARVFGAAKADEVGVAGADDVGVLGGEQVLDEAAGGEDGAFADLLRRGCGEASKGGERVEHEDSPYLAHRMHRSYRQTRVAP